MTEVTEPRADYIAMRDRVAAVARSLYQQHHDAIDELKRGAQELQRPDWLWFSLLLSLSTMGNSRGARLVKNKEFYDQVTYSALQQLSPTQRSDRLTVNLKKATVRMPDIKARWLSSDFEKIEAMGGAKAAKEQLLSEDGEIKKIAWLRQFDGIGKKYARNIMMDVYDPDFRGSIAADNRIQSISKEIGFSSRRYEEIEKFYVDVAHKAAIEPWELDRLMYRFKDEFLKGLGSSS